MEALKGVSRNNFKEGTGMKITPTLEECKNIAAEGDYGVIPHKHRAVCGYDHTHRSVRILKRSAVMSICWKARRRISDGAGIPF